uniref:Uncharacterized protein n=1 Tax=Bursaphelenchus xylophilus TaxID=6326 RepID=A0A1I7SCS3_BURXY
MPRTPRTDFRFNFRGSSVHSTRIEGNRGTNSWLDIYQNNKDVFNLINKINRFFGHGGRNHEIDQEKGRVVVAKRGNKLLPGIRFHSCRPYFCSKLCPLRCSD